MATGTEKLEQLIRELLDETIVDQNKKETAGYQLRQMFHKDPFLEMNSRGLSSWEQGLLFTMDRDFIIANTNGLRDIIERYQMESDWPPQGMDWKDDPLAEPEDADVEKFLEGLPWKPVPPPPQSTGGTVPFGALSTGNAGPGGWSDPGPHGRGFYPPSVALETPDVKLKLVGEGYLGSAEVIFRRQDIGFSKTVPVSHMHAENFRRIYLKTKGFDVTADEKWDAGDYEVLVRNEASLDYWLDAGLLFKVVEET